MILEYAHIYYEDILSNNIDREDLLKSIKIAKTINEKNNIDKNIVLVDDKNYNLSDAEKTDLYKYVSNYLSDLGMKPDEIYFEKDFARYSDYLYSKIMPDRIKIEPFKKQNKHVEFMLTDFNKIPLKNIYEDKTLYSCAFLSSLWSMYKSGVFDNSKNNLITILNKKYERVESHVEDIIKTLGHEVNNNYIWYS